MSEEKLRSYKPAEEDVTEAVIAAYTGALRGSDGARRSAFNVALRAYRMRYPGISEGNARRRVAQIICFADFHRSE